MRFLWNAVRAVVVEMMGVMLVLWLLFGTATWTLEARHPRPTHQTSLGDTLALRGLFTTIQTKTASWFRPSAVASNPTTVPATDVAKKLDYYSDLYRAAAERYVDRALVDLSDDLTAAL